MRKVSISKSLFITTSDRRFPPVKKNEYLSILTASIIQTLQDKDIGRPICLSLIRINLHLDPAYLLGGVEKRDNAIYYVVYRNPFITIISTSNSYDLIMPYALMLIYAFHFPYQLQNPIRDNDIYDAEKYCLYKKNIYNLSRCSFLYVIDLIIQRDLVSVPRLVDMHY